MMSSRILEGHSLISWLAIAKRHHHVGRVVRAKPPFAFNKIAELTDISLSNSTSFTTNCPEATQFFRLPVTKINNVAHRVTIHHASHHGQRPGSAQPTRESPDSAAKSCRAHEYVLEAFLLPMSQTPTTVHSVCVELCSS